MAAFKASNLGEIRFLLFKPPSGSEQPEAMDVSQEGWMARRGENTPLRMSTSNWPVSLESTWDFISEGQAVRTAVL